MGHTKKLFINAVMEVPCSTWRAWTKVSTLKNRLNRQASSVHSKRIIRLHCWETFWPKDMEQTQTGGYNGKYAIVKEERKVCLLYITLKLSLLFVGNFGEITPLLSLGKQRSHHNSARESSNHSQSQPRRISLCGQYSIFVSCRSDLETSAQEAVTFSE